MRYRAKRLITIRRGDSTIILTARDLALAIYVVIIVLVIGFGFILLNQSKIQEAQSLFTFFSGIGMAEVIEKLRRWREKVEVEYEDGEEAED